MAIDSQKLTLFIKKWMFNNDIVDIGFRELKKHHLYSRQGHSPNYEKKINNSNKYMISILVEMDKEMMSFAPQAPPIMEFSKQYLNCGVLAVKLAMFINNLGYSAKAHIDGKYDVVALWPPGILD